MTTAMTLPTSWRCRSCGDSNAMSAKACGCGHRSAAGSSELLLAVLALPRSQVSNPNAGVVYNNVYNFARGQGEVTVMMPQGRTSPDKEILSPGPRAQPYWTFTRVCLRAITAVCTLTVLGVFSTFLMVLYLAVMKILGH